MPVFWASWIRPVVRTSGGSTGRASGTLPTDDITRKTEGATAGWSSNGAQVKRFGSSDPRARNHVRRQLGFQVGGFAVESGVEAHLFGFLRDLYRGHHIDEQQHDVGE